MNKKQYLEAQRELIRESREEKHKRFEKFADFLIFMGYTALTVICYDVLYFNLDALKDNQHLFIWATGAWTMIWLFHLLSLMESNKSEEDKNDRK